MEKEFTVMVEKDEDGYYVASVVELPGCHTQAKSLGDLMKLIKEAIELYLEAWLMVICLSYINFHHG